MTWAQARLLADRFGLRHSILPCARRKQFDQYTAPRRPLPVRDLTLHIRLVLQEYVIRKMAAWYTGGVDYAPPNLWHRPSAAGFVLSMYTRRTNNFYSYGPVLLRCPETAKKDKRYVCPFSPDQQSWI